MFSLSMRAEGRGESTGSPAHLPTCLFMGHPGPDWLLIQPQQPEAGWEKEEALPECHNTLEVGNQATSCSEEASLGCPSPAANGM